MYLYETKPAWKGKKVSALVVPLQAGFTEVVVVMKYVYLYISVGVHVK